MPTPRAVTLSFSHDLIQSKGGKSLCEGLSAALQIGETLWIANDESASVERLTLTTDGARDHRQFNLADYIDLPVPRHEDSTPEIDIEGMDYADGWLWIAGSHSRKRGKLDAQALPGKAQKQLAEISSDANRCLIARIPVVTGEDGLPMLARRESREDGDRKAGMLKADPRASVLTRALRKDRHLAPFIGLPGKENGFDVEGLAVSGERVWLGLRGPVLAGWAVVLELRVKSGGKHGLQLARLHGGKRERVRKHFLPLGGLGIRDLCLVGEDLVLLAGPTMGLDGPVRIYRWTDAVKCEAPAVVGEAALHSLLDLPFGDGCDHAEGMAIINTGAQRGMNGLLVVYDKASQARRPGDTSVVADLFTSDPWCGRL